MRDRQIYEQASRLGIKRLIRVSLGCAVALLFVVTLSCGGVNFGDVQPKDLCKCVPLEPDSADFRHFQKHVPIPSMTPIEATVDIMLSWPQDDIVLPDAPRAGANYLCSMLRRHFYRTSPST